MGANPHGGLIYWATHCMGQHKMAGMEMRAFWVLPVVARYSKSIPMARVIQTCIVLREETIVADRVTV